MPKTNKCLGVVTLFYDEGQLQEFVPLDNHKWEAMLYVP